MKGFTENEKEQIRERLMLKGRELFGLQGIKRTSVEDLARSASIATGSFYLFFESKEALFYEIMMRDFGQNQAMFEKAFSCTEHPAMLLEMIMTGASDAMDKSPITKRILNMEEMEPLFRKLLPEQVEAFENATIVPMTENIRRWQEKGLIIPGDPFLYANIVSTVLLLVNMHRSQFPEKIRNQVIPTLAKFIAKELTDTAGKDNGKGGVI
jgi:AcrR family transcriptional regulator